jgi:hypothetical protein
MSPMRAIDWPVAIRWSDEFLATVLHHTIHFRSRARRSEGAGDTPEISKCQRKKAGLIAIVVEIIGARISGESAEPEGRGLFGHIRLGSLD